jgi:hypothetical protein
MGHVAQSGRGIAVLILFLVAAVACAVMTPAAGALTARFSVDDPDGYVRDVQVLVGDGGYTPFFRPGVVVWDGGSIISGHGADLGFEFPVQTLAMVPRACRSYVSPTGSAKVADMLAEAPYEVDAHHDSSADLNVCLVQVGGGDFRRGLTAAQVFEALRSYCLARRAAGFRVLVLTVLPSNRPETFEAIRLAYDAMLRDGWSQFADGLVDIAADTRIGETGDELDAQFYLGDQLHLTNAGNAVMASVAAPVLSAQPWTSARCELRARDAAGEWGPWQPWAAQRSLWLDDYQGEHVVEAEYRLDGGYPVAASSTVFVDSLRPEPRVLRDASARHGKQAKLRYEIDDAEPCGPTSTATITVTTRSGHVVKTLHRTLVAVNEPASAVFPCNLPKGSYRWSVGARDTAGNLELAPATGLLKVR